MAKTKLVKVEASIMTKGRFRDGSGKYFFNVYDAATNSTIHEEHGPYTQRSNTKRGCERWCAANGYKISRWVK
jgi:hypothetical protein